MAGDSEGILIAYDGSAHAREAIKQAGRHLKPCPALVVTVQQSVESLAFQSAWVMGAPMRQINENLAEEAAGIAAEGARLACEEGFEATAVVERSGGPVWATIVAVAADRKVDLIVLGSHGRSGLDYMVKGSVATAVTQHTKQSVMIAHAEGPIDR